MSDQVAMEPSMSKRTPMMVPGAADPGPWLATMAEKRTGSPATGAGGDHEMSVMMKSGTPEGGDARWAARMAYDMPAIVAWIDEDF